MLRSMYSGISGMKGFQNKLDVIGNNIANVNTFGFKKGRVTFKDMVSQQISGASAAAGGLGGTNPKQVGLGSQISTIDTLHTQGSLQTTARPLDLGISGDGFFVLKNNTGDTLYTRSGNFYLDVNGDIVNSDGYYLQGATGSGANKKINISTDTQSFSIGADGSISVVGGTLTGGKVQIAKFPNPDGLEKVGSNMFISTNNSGTPVLSDPGAGGAGKIVAGTLEMSNVDLSEEFTEMIVAQRGFQANTRIITTSDEILQELVNLKR
ncbi:flagellar basal body rod protein FlgG [Bacillus sp. B190/17]|uniref:Flagellar hook protein FlgE n=1 Tax=Bacillus lumedeiriae TaxID=3058829 RepID=A0ABW8I673_9BACI